MAFFRSTTLAVVSIIATSPAAMADISVCNEFRARVHVALAYEDSSGFHSAGWWSVDPNACRDIDFSFQSSTLYFTANSDSYREGRQTMTYHWGNKKELFVGSKDFRFDDADRRRRGGKPAMFSFATLSPQLQSKPVTITIRFALGGTTTSIKPK